MHSIPFRVMPGGDGGKDLDLILDNDTVQPQMEKSGATFPGGSEKHKISVLCVAPIWLHRMAKETVGVLLSKGCLKRQIESKTLKYIRT